MITPQSRHSMVGSQIQPTKSPSCRIVSWTCGPTVQTGKPGMPTKWRWGRLIPIPRAKLCCGSRSVCRRLPPLADSPEMVSPRIGCSQVFYTELFCGKPGGRLSHRRVRTGQRHIRLERVICSHAEAVDAVISAPPNHPRADRHRCPDRRTFRPKSPCTNGGIASFWPGGEPADITAGGPTDKYCSAKKLSHVEALRCDRRTRLSRWPDGHRRRFAQVSSSRLRCHVGRIRLRNTSRR